MMNLKSRQEKKTMATVKANDLEKNEVKRDSIRMEAKSKNPPRDLTEKEKALIKQGVEHFCPKYKYQHDARWGKKRRYCTAFDCDCIMENMQVLNGFCSRFEKVILPAMPELQRLLENRHRQCIVCGNYFAPHGRANTCSEECWQENKRRKDTQAKRKRRNRDNG